MLRRSKTDFFIWDFSYFHVAVSGMEYGLGCGGWGLAFCMCGRRFGEGWMGWGLDRARHSVWRPGSVCGRECVGVQGVRHVTVTSTDIGVAWNGDEMI